MTADEDVPLSPGDDETLAVTRDAQKILSVLKEMKYGLDVVRARVETLTIKVRQNQLPTAEGLSYLEAKHLMLLNYCQCIVYYVLRKANGLSVQNHPLIKSLLETRLFLEKIRPIDKKLEYQVQKLTRAASNFVLEKALESSEKGKENSQAEEDPLTFKPNPDMLVPKGTTVFHEDAKYLPPRIAPTTMEYDGISKKEKQAHRREKEMLRQARQDPFLKGMMDDLEGRPEEVTEAIGADTRELRRYKAKLDEQARQEEELFTRAPRTKRDKKIEKYMKTRNGLLGMTDGFYDEIKMLPMGENENAESSFGNFGAAKGRMAFKKRKRKH